MSNETKKATITGGGGSLSGRHTGYEVRFVPVLHPGDERQVCAGLTRSVRIQLYLAFGEYKPASERKQLAKLVGEEVELTVSGKVIKGFVHEARYTQHVDDLGADTSATVEFNIFAEERYKD